MGVSRRLAGRGTGTVLATAMLLGVTAAPFAQGEVLERGSTHYVLRQSGYSALAPAALWERLVHPARWWNPAHTYSGDARNLSLQPDAGGLWREDWDGGAVAHGSVLLWQPPHTLRLAAPFGPLQGLGVHAVWTITITAQGDGSQVSFDETASGPPGANFKQLATAVDGVKTEALRRLLAD